MPIIPVSPKRKIKLVICPMAARHNAKAARQFAHVFHVKNSICIAPKMLDLPPEFIAGILLHEIGHLALVDTDSHTETDADRFGFYLSGVKVYRRNLGNKKNLECVRKADLKPAFAFLRRYVNIK